MVARLHELNPWRRIIVLAFVLVLLSVVFNLAHDTVHFVPAHYQRLVEWGLVIVWCLIGIWLVRYLNHFIVNKTLGRHLEVRTARLLNRCLALVGYIFIFLVALNLLQIRLGSLLVGGAVTGVIVGIAAQSTLSNLFAGFILITLRPFSVGQYVKLRSSTFGVEYGGIVFDVNWFYTILLDGDQRRVLPNSSVIVSAVTLNVKEQATTQVFKVPIAYSVSEKDISHELHKRTSGKASIKIREFNTDAYTAEIHLPAREDPGIIREILAKHQVPSQGSSN